MNKLREKFKKHIIISWDMTKKTMDIEKEKKAVLLEQITDDFSCQLLVWYDTIMLDSSTKYLNKSKTELQQYFKENVYGK